jgi:predicted dehydrogenase
MPSDDRRIRYAVVGLGNIAQVAVLPAFEHASATSELVALVSSDPHKVAELARRHDVKHTGSYDDLERVLADARVDAVYVAVPNTMHRAITERAAQAGTHVLCEKPMAMTAEDCRAMIAATKRRGVKLMIAYRLHFEETNLGAIERIRAGEIGEPRIFSSVFCHQVRHGIRTADALGGGALFDLGVYCVNAARYLFRDEPYEVQAQQITGVDDRSREVDDTTSAVMRFPGSRIAQLTVSQGAADISELRVVGTKGDIRLDPAYEYRGELRTFVTVDGKTNEQTTPMRDQFAPEIDYFSRCIRSGEEPVPSGEEGLADVVILQAIVESARTGAKVKVARVQRDARPDGRLAARRPPVGHVDALRAPPPSK